MSGDFRLLLLLQSKDYSDTITQKRSSGTLESSKCDADVPKYGARTFALFVSVQRPKVTQSSSGKRTVV